MNDSKNINNGKSGSAKGDSKWSSEPMGRETQPMEEFSDELKQSTSEAKDEMSKKASHLGSEAKEKTESKVHSVIKQNKKAATEEIGSFIEVLRETSGKLESEDHNTAAEYSQKLADGLERLNESIKQRDVKETMKNIEDFARRQPWLFVGGAVAGGFALSRFLKSSSSSQSSEHSGSESQRSDERIKPVEGSSIIGAGQESGRKSFGSGDYEADGEDFESSFDSAMKEDEEERREL